MLQAKLKQICITLQRDNLLFLLRNTDLLLVCAFEFTQSHPVCGITPLGQRKVLLPAPDLQALLRAKMLHGQLLSLPRFPPKFKGKIVRTAQTAFLEFGLWGRLGLLRIFVDKAPSHSFGL